MMSLLLAAIVTNTAQSQSYTREADWTSVGAGAFASDGSNVWVLTNDGTQVTTYDASGGELSSWSTGVSETDVTGRGIGFDAEGRLHVMTFSRTAGATVRKFEADGTLLGSEPFPYPGRLGFEVDADGNIYGGDDAFDERVKLLSRGSDGTRYFSGLDNDTYSLFADGPGSTMIPTEQRCGGPANISENCFNVIDVAATDSRVYVAAAWCDAEDDCGSETRVFGPGVTLLGTIPQLGELTLGASGAVYVLLGSGVIEKWVPSVVTSGTPSTWGALKVRYR